MAPDMTEEEAVAIARRFAEAEGLKIGPLSHAMPDSDYEGDVRLWTSYNRIWSVWFHYDGPPPDPNKISCPAEDSPTGIEVDIFTSEAFLIGLL